MNMIYFWLCVSACTFFIEVGHPGLFLSLALSIGSLGAAAAAHAGLELAVQLLVCIASSVCSFWLLRTYVVQKTANHKTNIQALVGAHGLVTQRITSSMPGRVRINGEEWRAKSLHEVSLESGSRVYVVRIERATLIVSSSHQA